MTKSFTGGLEETSAFAVSPVLPVYDRKITI